MLGDKVSLITSVSTKLGHAVANRLGLAGSRIFVTDPDESVLKGTVEHFQNIGVKVAGAIANLDDAEQRKLLFKEVERQFGQLDVFVCYPGDNKLRGNIIDATREDLDRIYNQYLTVPFMLSKESLPLLKQSRNGSIILLTSISGYTSFYDIGLYSAAQTGMLGLCKALSQSLSRRGIRCNAVATGLFEDDGSNGLWMQGDKCATQQLVPMIPMQRLGNCHDCTGLIEFLASDLATYITGEIIPVTGGINIKL